MEGRRKVAALDGAAHNCQYPLPAESGVRCCPVLVAAKGHVGGRLQRSVPAVAPRHGSGPALETSPAIPIHSKVPAPHCSHQHKCSTRSPWLRWALFSLREKSAAKAHWEAS